MWRSKNSFAIIRRSPITGHSARQQQRLHSVKLWLYGNLHIAAKIDHMAHRLTKKTETPLKIEYFFVLNQT
jgi:hypothetical protein